MKISERTRFILLNIIAALILFIIIGSVVIFGLNNYTKHGDYIVVPAFNDLTPDEAEQIATHNNLRVVIIDSIFDEEAKPGTILEQYPSAGSQVKDKRLIHLTINAQSPEKIAFPNLQNAAYRQTLQTLESKGFKIGHIEFAPSEFKNLVLGLTYGGREITPGTLLPKGTTVNIILGDGNSEDNTVFVPALVGKKLKDAVSLAQNAYLNIGQVIPDASIKTKADLSQAFVYKQSLGRQSAVAAGTPITLHITLSQNKVEQHLTDTLTPAATATTATEADETEE